MWRFLRLKKILTWFSKVQIVQIKSYLVQDFALSVFLNRLYCNVLDGLLLTALQKKIKFNIRHENKCYRVSPIYLELKAPNLTL